MLILKYSESAMNGYVTKKENIRIFKTNGEEPRGKGFIRGKNSKKSGESACDAISNLVREFRGEIVCGDKMKIYSF